MGALVAGLTSWLPLVIGGIALVLLRRYVKAIESRADKASEMAEMRSKLSDLEEAVSRLSEEVERVSEAQRFAEKLLAQSRRE